MLLAVMPVLMMPLAYSTQPEVPARAVEMLEAVVELDPEHAQPQHSCVQQRSARFSTNEQLVDPHERREVEDVLLRGR